MTSRRAVFIATVVAGVVLATPSAMAATPDASSGGTPGGSNQVAFYSPIGQRFTAGTSGDLDSVAVYLSPASLSLQGTPLVVEVRELDGSRFPVASALGSTTITPSGGAAWFTASFTGVTLAAGTEYAIVLSQGSADAMWNACGSAPPNGLTAYTGSWQVLPDVQCFRTFMATPGTGEAPPPILQQYGIEPGGQCTGSSPVQAFLPAIAGQEAAGWNRSWARWASREGWVCTREVALVGGRWVIR